MKGKEKGGRELTGALYVVCKRGVQDDGVFEFARAMRS